MIPPRCKPHQQPAGWKCQGCNELLCPDCAAIKTVNISTSLEVCLSCGELAVPLTQHRSTQRGFVARIPGALIWPLTKSGLAALFGVAVVRAITSYFIGLGWAIGACVLAAVCFGIMRSTARGSDEVDTTDWGDLWSDVVVPGIKALIGAALVWVPAVVWIASRHSNVLERPMAVLTDPVVWLLLAAGVFYAPMAILAGAAGSSLLVMLSPPHVIRNALKLGPPYFVLVAALCALLVPWFLSLGAGALLNFIRVPILPRVLDYALACYVPFVASRIMGLLLLTHGDRVDYGLERDYQVPLLAGVAPRGLVPEAPPEQQRKVRAPIELEPEPEPVVEAELEKPRELDPAKLPPLKVESEH